MNRKMIIPTNCFFSNGSDEYELERIEVASTGETQTIIPPEGVFFDKVTVRPVQAEEKTVTPAGEEQIVLPENGKMLSKVTVERVPTEEKKVVPLETAQIITPSEGKFLSKVRVEATEPSHNGFPIEISDTTELEAVPANIDNIGKVYRYSGPTTDTYIQNGLYMCIDDEWVIY